MKQVRRFDNHHRLLILFLLTLLFFGGCASLPENTGQVPSTAIKDVSGTTLGRAVAAEQGRQADKSGFVLLGNGLDAFVARVILADLAEKSLDVQYYLFHDDLVGDLLAYTLLQAADRGVRIRLLLDDMGLDGRDLDIATLNSHPDIEIRIFNPFTRGMLRSIQFLSRFGSVTRRMHNKSFTVDNSIAIVGGRNIGNEYFEADPDLAFGDLDVMTIGPVVKDISSSFDAYWNSELAYPITTLKQIITGSSLEELRPKWALLMSERQDSEYVAALKRSSLVNQIKNGTLQYQWGQAIVLADKPEKISADVQVKDFYLAPLLEKYLEQTEEELIILSAYFVPGRQGVDFLKSLRKRGVRVRILTNSLASNDVPLVHAGYARYRREMLRAGIELYELDKRMNRKKRQEKKKSSGLAKASLHAKTFVLDRRAMFVGSFNFDPRSFYENTEIGVLFDSPALAGPVARQFDRLGNKGAFQLELVPQDGVEDSVDLLRWITVRDGRKEIFTTDPYTSLWRRFILSVAGWLPIESQL
jgi:putative cardiolipin synthase